MTKIGDYVAAEQAAGRVRGDVDPYAVAASFVGTCVMRAVQSALHLPTRRLPSLTAVIQALDTMLEPPG